MHTLHDAREDKPWGRLNREEKVTPAGVGVVQGYTAKNISSSPSDYYTAKNTSSSNHTYYVAQNASSYYDAGSDSNAPVYYTAPNVTGSDSDKVYYVAKNARYVI